MKEQTIWNLEDILDAYENERLDLQMDYKNSELKNKKNLIKSKTQNKLRIINKI